jgi:hypothetical protein
MKPEAKSAVLGILTRVSERDGSANKTKLLKLLYLADIEHYRRTGETLTGFDWIFYFYGPWAPQYDDVLSQLEAEGVLRREGWAAGDFEGERLVAASPVDLSSVIKDTVSFLRTRQLIDVWADRAVPPLLDYVYFETEPMQGAEKMKPLDFTKVSKEIPQSYRRTGSGTEAKALRQVQRRIAEARQKLQAEIDRTASAVKRPVYDDDFLAAYEALNAPEAD